MASPILRVAFAVLAAGALSLPLVTAPALGVSQQTFTAIAVGTGHTCALTSAGGVSCWGSNGSGQLGNGSTTESRTPVDVVGLTSGVTAIAAGQASTCALTKAGGVKCWGANDYGLLGNGSTAARATPVAVSGLASGVTAISVGFLHACALTEAGGVKCWGALLRDGSLSARTTPVDIFGVTSGIRSISAGYYDTCAVTTGGGAKCWGGNEHGQLGIGTTVASDLPVTVSGLSSGVTAIAAGWQHTCALITGGRMKCWGYNHVAQLGNGAIPWQWEPGTEPQILVPADVLGLTGATGIAVGGEHTCAVTSDGYAACWGGNSNGQLGDGTRVPSGSPVVVAGLSGGVAAVAAGVAGDHTCALTSAGDIACWGANRSGQLGNGSTTDSSDPVIVDATMRPAIILGSSTRAGTIAAGSTLTFTATVRPVDANTRPTVRFEIFRQDGGLWTLAARRDVAAGPTGRASLRWTFATEGQRYIRARSLDNAPDAASNWSGSIPYTVQKLPAAPVAITSIAAGVQHTCALSVDGGIRCWGWNGNGQLGNGTRINSSSVPVDVVGLPEPASAIAGGGTHTCAVLRSGAVACWGGNGSGQLGSSPLSESSVPLAVEGIGSRVTDVTAGGTHTCVLTISGGVKCWGSNEYGQLGDGATTPSSTPVDVQTLSSGVRAIAAGGASTCAITSDGAATCWGAIGSPSPGAVPGLAAGVVSITVGQAHACALTTAGAVTCWGGLASRQTDDGGLLLSSAATPQQVPGLTAGVRSISAGDFQTCAVLRTDGAVCWGDNRHGQLGNGTTALSTTPVGVAGLASGVARVTAGYGHSCALLTGAGVTCWGWNDAGVLGNGASSDSRTPVDVLGTFTRRPDGRVQAGSHTPAGNNIYNATGSGQSVTGSAGRGATLNFTIVIQNDGNGAEQFEVGAGGGVSAAYTVRYFRGSADITTAIVAGTYRTPPLARGATYAITARVSVGATAATSSSVTRLVTITSLADVPAKDTVRFVARRA